MSDVKNVRYSDGFIHEIIETDKNETKKGIIFPFTRYANVLNRPKVTDNIRSSGNPDFLLVPVEEEEIDDATVYEMFGQEW